MKQWMGYLYFEEGRGPAYCKNDGVMECFGIPNKKVPGCKYYVRKKNSFGYVISRLLQVKEEDRCTPFHQSDLGDITCEWHRYFGSRHACANPEVKLAFALEGL